MNRIASTFALLLIVIGFSLVDGGEPVVLNGDEAAELPDATFGTRSDAMHLAIQANDLILDNGTLRLVLRKTDAGYRPEYHALDAEGTWRPIARDARPGDEIATAWAYGGCPPPVAYSTAEVTRNDAAGITLQLKSKPNGFSIVTTVSLDTDSPFFHIIVECSITGRVAFEQCLSSFAFVPSEGGPPDEDGPARAPDKPDFAWAPRLRGQRNDVIGDELFGTPAVMLQKGTAFAAVVPDVAALARDRTMQTALNLDTSRGGAWMSYGLMKYETRDGGFHHHTAAMFDELADGTLRYSFLLFVDAQARPLTGFSSIADFLWDTLEKPAPIEQVRLQQRDFDAWRRDVWPATVAYLRGLDEVSFTADEQTLRIAFGMAMHARRTGDEDIGAAARRILDLALAAPLSHGAFPVVFRPGAEGNGGQWATGVDGHENAFSTSDCSNTARWLLRWRGLLEESDTKIIERCKALGDLLVKVQLPSGCIPAWLKPEEKGLKPLQDALYDAGAESAESAVFLAELFAATTDERYLIAAMSVLQFIQRDVLPAQRWIDRRTLDAPKDTFSGQHAQSMASMVSATQACTVIYKQTGKKEYLALAEHVVGYIMLFQNAWECEWSQEPFGAIPLRNFGSGLSAGLQARAASAFIEFSHLTGSTDHLDRGLAALRSAFATPDGLRSVADALTFAEMLSGFFGDAVIDVAAGWGRGIDGCLLADLAVAERSVSFDLISPFPWERPALVKFLKCPTDREVIVNGKSLGVFTAAQLSEGVRCPIRQPLTIEFGPVETSLAGIEVKLSAKVYGGEVDPAVRLFCRRQGPGDFIGTPMAAGEGMTYTTAIPRDLLAEPGKLEYYVAAASGDETAASPPGAPEAAIHTLSVTADLTIMCGVDDAAYLDGADSGKATELGRVISGKCVYVLPVPNGAKAISLEIECEGLSAVYIGGALLTPLNGQGPTRVYHLKDPSLWRDQDLRIEIQAPEAADVILHKIKLTPKKDGD